MRCRRRDPRHAHPGDGARHQDFEQRLTELSKTNPVFAPGVQNYVAMGGVRSVWTGDLRQGLREALAASPSTERGPTTAPCAAAVPWRVGGAAVRPRLNSAMPDTSSRRCTAINWPT